MQSPIERKINLSIDAEMRAREIVSKQLDSVKKIQNPFGIAMWEKILKRNRDRTSKKKSQLQHI